MAKNLPVLGTRLGEVMDVSSLRSSVRYPVIARKYPVTECRFPVEDCRYPVSKEDMAVFLGSGLPCVTLAQCQYCDVLHDSVMLLVFNIARKYKTFHGVGIEDLSQDCWYRILRKLHLYDPTRSSFTTWCSKVCFSVLNKGYERNKLRSHRFVSFPDGLDESRISENPSHSFMLGHDIRQTVTELMSMYPSYKHVLIEMFGDIENGMPMPSRINIRSISKRSGSPKGLVSRFYRDVVQPYFIKRFKGKKHER